MTEERYFLLLFISGLSVTSRVYYILQFLGQNVTLGGVQEKTHTNKHTHHTNKHTHTHEHVLAKTHTFYTHTNTHTQSVVFFPKNATAAPAFNRFEAPIFYCCVF